MLLWKLPIVAWRKWQAIKTWQRALAWLGFLGCFGFSGGGLFLLYALVPLEARLQAAGLAQGQIDRWLQATVAAWSIASLVVSWLYYRLFLARPRRRTLAYAALGLSVLTAAAVFALFLRTGTGLVALSRGETQSLGERFTFGPYPDRGDLEQLKQQGYDAVVTLLSPAIPFEKVLLDEELANGAAVGIKVYSFPMLPWISDNAGALAAIHDLAAQGKTRIYFHCYLGKHRALLVQQTLARSGSVAAADNLEPLPDRLERGPLHTYAGERILVGPFPTDEEWFDIVLRRQVQEVVLTLDPADPANTRWIDQAHTIAQGYGVAVSARTLDPRYPDPVAARQITQYVRGLEHTVYVVGFKDDNWMTSLDALLSGGEAPMFRPALPDRFERGEVLRLGERLLFGPYPTDDELTLLKTYGVREMVTLLDDGNPDDRPWIEQEQAWAAAQGVTIRHLPLPAAGASPAQVQAVATYLQETTGTVYVHSFRTDGRVQAVLAAVQGAGN